MNIFWFTLIVFLLIFFLFWWNRKVVRTVWDPKLCQDKKKCSRSSELTIFPLSYWRRYRGSWRRIDWISSSIQLQWNGTNCNESCTKNYFIIWTWKMFLVLLSKNNKTLYNGNNNKHEGLKLRKLLVHHYISLFWENITE
jgi:hypothetical protein